MSKKTEILERYYGNGYQIILRQTTPTGPWLDNGPIVQEWFLVKDDSEITNGSSETKLEVEGYLKTRDHGSVEKVQFKNGKTLKKQYQINYDENNKVTRSKRPFRVEYGVTNSVTRNVAPNYEVLSLDGNFVSKIVRWFSG